MGDNRGTMPSNVISVKEKFSANNLVVDLSNFIFLYSGFCKNEKNHEVYLLVEAFTAGDSTSSKLKKVGEGKFAIYPRPNAPKLNRFANPGEDFYNYTDIMGLLRTHSTENIQMHCGRIRSNYSLHEVVIKPPTPPRSPPRPVSQVRTPLPIKSPPPPSERFPSPSPRLTPPRPVPRLATSGTQTPSIMMQERRQSPDYSVEDFTAPPSPPLPPAADGKRVSLIYK